MISSLSRRLTRYLTPVLLILIGLLGYLPGLEKIQTASDGQIYIPIARNMAVHGDWLLPRNANTGVIEGAIFLEKPPLAFWLQGISMEILGPTVFAARLPSVLASISTALVLYFIGHQLYDKWAGTAAGFITLVMPAIYWHGHAGRTATTDIFLLLFGTLFVWFVWRAQEDTRFLRYAGVAGGLAVMSKQFAAGVYLLISLPYLLKVLRGVSLREILEFVGLGAVVVLPWNLYAYYRYPARYLHQMIIEQAVGRLGTSQDPPSLQAMEPVGPFNLFYFVRFPYYVGPFFFTLLGGLALALRDIYGRTDTRRAGIFLIWWLLTPLLFFTLSTSSTWIHYAMGVVPPVCLLSGYFVAEVYSVLREVFTSRTNVEVPYELYAATGAILTVLMLLVYPPHQNGLV